MNPARSAAWWAIRGAPPLLMLLGGALIIESVLNGSSRFELFLIVPVISGSAPILLLGVVLLLLGFFLLPLALSRGGNSTSTGHPAEGADRHPSGQGPLEGDAVPRSGGFVLIGPVPVLFGSFRGLRRRYVLLLAVAGAMLLLALVLLATLG